jgi:hypothetical protein
MKDLGEDNVIMSINYRSEKIISLDQSHYVEKILRKYKYFDCKHACTPYDPGEKLFTNTGECVRASLVALSMSLIALNPTLSMSWECCAGLLVDLIMSIVKLLIGS